jgi:hypothetical protein
MTGEEETKVRNGAAQASEVKQVAAEFASNGEIGESGEYCGELVACRRVNVT